MKKTVALALAILLLCSCAAFADAEPELAYSIDRESLYLYDSYGSAALSYVAQITNTGETGIYLRNGVLTLLDAEGETLLEISGYSIHPAKWAIAPGESTYVMVDEYLSADAAVESPDSWKLALEFAAVPGDYEIGAMELKTSELSIDVERGYVYATLSNETGETIWDSEWLYVIESADGKLMAAAQGYLFDIGLPAYSSVMVRESISSGLMQAWSDAGDVPANVTAIAWSDR